MDYDTVKSHVFAHGTAPDGYFGDRAHGGFALVDHDIVFVHDTGYCRTMLPPVLDESEALWTLKNHPYGKRYYTITA